MSSIALSRETVPLSHAAAKVALAASVDSNDRQERASETSTRSTLSEVGGEFSMSTAAIVKIDEVVAHLGERLTSEDRRRIAEYRARYGVAGT